MYVLHKHTHIYNTFWGQQNISLQSDEGWEGVMRKFIVIATQSKM